MKAANVPNYLRQLLPALLLSVGACSTPSVAPQVVQCPAIPERPALSQPIPSQTYSERAQQKFKTWREQLTATPQTSKP
ncbi:hypothetical protein A8M77_30905 [Variovorax sp. JS1663]|nr:hypothetical protein A8M77_30905 [Variovorax sp. JS1663]